MYLYPTHPDIIINFVQKCTFFQKKKIMQNEGVIKYVHKTDP